ncbi:hypothetical protein ACFWNE_07610 [Streptomyces goshikiensis]|uniref:hypothetical protein n=1 Tax=Streptomyces goshikiensis TaxID=1942 RepID=UPI003655F54B
MTYPILIEQPDEIETAWAQHADRQRIIDTYDEAVTKADRAAARWEALAWDDANRGSSSIIAEIDGQHTQAA